VNSFTHFSLRDTHFLHAEENRPSRRASHAPQDEGFVTKYKGKVPQGEVFQIYRLMI